MLEFVKNWFRNFIEVTLLFILIASAIIGAYLFDAINHQGVLGFIVGAVIGIIIDIILGGFIATILNMDKNLEILAGRDSSSAINSAIKKAIAPVIKSSFTDSRDGKTYKTVKIGGQTWMAENLAYECEGSKCYGNNPANCQKYGRLYDWETAKKACPSGWHLPSDAEWETLTTSVGGSSTAGTMLKSVNGWADNGNGEDAFGFSALPGGSGFSDGSFDNVGKYGYWWSATEHNASDAYIRNMDHDYANVYSNFIGKTYLSSVRCVQD